MKWWVSSMEYIYIGEVVNTHGIKGELRIVSSFQYKDKAFIKGKSFYLGKRHQEMKLNSYRRHKDFDMVTFEGIDNINEAIAFKGDKVYVKRADIEVDGYFDEDLIGLNVIADSKEIGTVARIVESPAHRIIIVSGNSNCMIPYVDEYIKNINLDDKTITINPIKGLLDEN